MFLVGPKVFSFVVKAVKVIFWGVQRGLGLLFRIESYGKVEISYINVDNFYMDNDRDIKFDIVIGHH